VRAPVAAAPALEPAARSDEAAWREIFARAGDVSGLWSERNVLRYRPVPVEIRLGVGGSEADLLRVVAAGLRAGAPMRVSTESPLAATLPVEVRVEDDLTWAEALPAGRVRLIGTSKSLDGSPDRAVWPGPVTASGRLEMLPFLREQAVSITAHRFGNPDPLATGVL
jgi:RHH-type proline utilization regulon transcriptional repressor/proline dehydrogenase/delta 1-pyrroline-5-carboxylate dehydrogenase